MSITAHLRVYGKCPGSLPKAARLRSCFRKRSLMLFFGGTKKNSTSRLDVDAIYILAGSASENSKTLRHERRTKAQPLQFEEDNSVLPHCRFPSPLSRLGGNGFSDLCLPITVRFTQHQPSDGISHQHRLRHQEHTGAAPSPDSHQHPPSTPR